MAATAAASAAVYAAVAAANIVTTVLYIDCAAASSLCARHTAEREDCHAAQKSAQFLRRRDGRRGDGSHQNRSAREQHCDAIANQDKPAGEDGTDDDDTFHVDLLLLDSRSTAARKATDLPAAIGHDCDFKRRAGSACVNAITGERPLCYSKSPDCGLGRTEGLGHARSERLHRASKLDVEPVIH